MKARFDDLEVTRDDLQSRDIYADSDDPYRDIVTLVPAEIAYIFSWYLDSEDLVSAFQVSKSWNALFDNVMVFKNKLNSDFHIDIERLNEIEASHHPACLKQLYNKLCALSRKQHAPNMPTEISNLLSNPHKQRLVVTVCLDECEHLDFITRDEFESYLMFAIFSGSNRVAKHLVNLSMANAAEYFAMACQAGNLELVQFLLKSNLHKLFIQNDTVYLFKAILSGNKDLVQFILEQSGMKFQFSGEELFSHAQHRGKQYSTMIAYLINYLSRMGEKIYLSDTLLEAVATTGNKEMFVRLTETLEDKRQSSYMKKAKKLLGSYFHQTEDNEGTVIGVFNAACESGNVTLVEYLLHGETKYRVKYIYPVVFPSVVISDNIELFKYLKNYCIHTKRMMDWRLIMDFMLHRAVNHHQIKFIEYLLDPSNAFNLTINQALLNNAAETGSVSLLRSLLEKNSDLNPDPITLQSAIDSHSPELVFYLLNANNNFNIDTDRVFEKAKEKYGMLISLSISDTTRQFAKWVNSDEKNQCFTPSNFLDPKYGHNLNTFYKFNPHITTTIRLLYANVFFKMALANLSNSHCDFGLNCWIAFSFSPQLFINHIRAVLMSDSLKEEQHLLLKGFIRCLSDSGMMYGFSASEIQLVKELNHELSGKGVVNEETYRPSVPNF